MSFSSLRTILIPLTAYVAGYVLSPATWHVVLSFVGLAVGGVVYWLFFVKHLSNVWSVRFLPGFSFFLFWVAMGMAASIVDGLRLKRPVGDQVSDVTVEILDQPQRKTKSMQTRLIIRSESSGKWNGKKVMSYWPVAYEKDASFKMGTRWTISFSCLSDAPMDWLHRESCCATVWVDARTSKCVRLPSCWNIRARAASIQADLLDRYQSMGLEDLSVDLVAAMCLGDKKTLDVETRQHFSATGLAHLLAVSGMHVGLLFALLQFFMRPFAVGSIYWKAGIVLSILLLLMYALVTGLSASVCRSVLMFVLVLFGQLYRHRNASVYTVLLSAFILLLWHPGFLYDLGFQLSYIAVLGILLGQKRLLELFEQRFHIPSPIASVLCISLLAQLATSPLTVYYFHQFPRWFLLSNLLMAPLAALLLYSGVFALLLADIPFLNVFSAYLLNLICKSMLGLTAWMSDWPGALLILKPFSQGWIYLFYVLFGLMLNLWYRKRWTGLLLVLLTLVLMQIIYLMDKFQISNIFTAL
ncbi:MAG TPA: ComEC/Rec2 family competence protein [Bacteroidales bacterium]|nr:ComEC/Rec2 family competence protein [Bacteroidales bacterium]